MNHEFETRISPVHAVAGRVQEYADRGIYASGEYRQILDRYDVDNKPLREDILKLGVYFFVSRFQTLQKMQDSQTRLLIQKELEEEGSHDETYSLLLSIDENTDPGGVDALRKCCEIDKARRILESNDPFLMNTEVREREAEMLGYTENLMIDRYEEELIRVGYRKAPTDQS